MSERKKHEDFKITSVSTIIFHCHNLQYISGRDRSAIVGTFLTKNSIWVLNRGPHCNCKNAFFYRFFSQIGIFFWGGTVVICFFLFNFYHGVKNIFCLNLTCSPLVCCPYCWGWMIHSCFMKKSSRTWVFRRKLCLLCDVCHFIPLYISFSNFSNRLFDKTHCSNILCLFCIAGCVSSF